MIKNQTKMTNTKDLIEYYWEDGETFVVEYCPEKVMFDHDMQLGTISFRKNRPIKMAVDIELKPTFLRNWEIVRETKSCYVIRKPSPHKWNKGRPITNYVPKNTVKQIIQLMDQSGEQN